MTDKVLDTIRRYGMLAPGDRLLVGVSGGADSIALLLCMCELAGTLGITVAAAHFNHMLRGDEADRDQDFVAALCREQGVDLMLGAVDVAAEAARAGAGVEETARRCRYLFFRDAAADSGCNKVGTAHNANDNTETVLFNLARGTGIQGLCGIPPVRGEIIRPLIEVTRAEIEGYLSERGVSYVTDSSNADTRYSRNRLRRNVVPELLQINPALHEAVTGMTRLLRADAGFIAGAALAALGQAERGDGEIALPAERFLSHGAPVCGRMVQLAVGELGGGLSDLGAAQIEAILKLAESGGPSGSVDLPGGIVAAREYERLIFRRAGEDPTFNPIPLCPGMDAPIPGTGMRVGCALPEKGEKIQNTVNTFYINCDKIKGGLFLRPRAEGDGIELPGRPPKTLKKLFIDEKVPRRMRGMLPVLADTEKVLAVAGFGVHAPAAAAGPENAIKIIIEADQCD